MNNYLTVFNITPLKNDRVNWKDYWKIEWITDDKIIFKSKEKYKYDFEEDTMKFDYHLILTLEVVEIEKLNEQIYSTLYLVPTAEYLNPEQIQRVCKDYDIKPHMIDFDTMSNYFMFPILATEVINVENIQEFSEKDEYIENIYYLLQLVLKEFNGC